MAVKRNGLGKGLDSLIPNKTVKTTEKQANKTQKEKVKVEKSGETIVKITQVEPNSEQPRKDFDEDALLELADSIKQFGVLQPLLVQKKNDYYEIIAGERRWRAAKLAGLKEVPVLVREYTEQEVVEISLIENIQRENLNPIEEAIAYKRLLKEFHLKQDEIAERVSKSRTAVTNSMRLLKLNSKVQQMVIDDMISTGHARALLALEDEEQQYTIANKIFDDGCLKRNCASEYDGVNDFSTNKDYIYFTNNIALAIRCARNSASNQKDKHILIFELDIDRKDLLPDEDELRIATQDLPYIQRSNTPKVDGEFNLEKSMYMFNSCRVAHDIDLKTHAAKYVILKPINELKIEESRLLKEIDEYLCLTRGYDTQFEHTLDDLHKLEEKLFALHPLQNVE